MLKEASWAMRIQQVLNLRSDERRPVALLWAHSFFLGVGVAYLISAALPIFLSSFPIDYLPLAFALAAAFELLIGYISKRLEHAIGQIRSLRLVLLLLVVGTVAFLAMAHTSSTPHGSSAIPLGIAFGLLVWSRIMIFVSQNEFWGLPLQLFDVRQGKRLFSLIDSGAFLAKILGYFSVPLLTKFLSVPDLLILSCMGTAVSVYVLQQIIKNYADVIEPTHKGVGKKISHSGSHALPAFRSARANQKHATVASSEHPLNPTHAEAIPSSRPSRSSLAFLWQHNYLMSVALVAFLALFAGTCIDYGFLREIEHRKESLTNVANFLALILGVAKLASLIFKVGFVGRLFSRFGLAKTSIVLPLGLFIATAGGLVFSANSTETSMLWWFIASMVLVELWSDAVLAPAIVIAVQPLPMHLQHRGHQAIGGIIEPMALGANAVLLYVLSVSVGFSLRGISVMMLAVFAAWAIALFWFGHEYKTTVLRALKHRRLRSAELVWDAGAREMIAEKLHSSHAAESEYALHLIPADQPSFLIEALPRLLEHPDLSVRIAALRRLDDFELPSTERQQVEVMLEGVLNHSQHNINDRDGNLLGQALRVYTAVCPEIEAEDLEHWLDDERLPVREGLLAGLIKHKGIDGVLIAGAFVQSMVRSTNPSECVAAAEIIGKVGVRQFYHSLLSLLSHKNVEVCHAAIRASAQVAHPRLIEPLLDLYLLPEPTRKSLLLIENALRAIGNPVLPHLLQRLEAGRVDSTRLQRIARLLGLWSSEDHSALSERSLLLLTELLDWPARSIVGDASWSLGTLRLAALRALTSNAIKLRDPARVNRLLLEELHRAQILVSIIHTIDSDAEHQRSQQAKKLLCSTLGQEIARGAERVLFLLELQYDPATLHRVRDSLLVGESLHYANAFEVLEHLLPPDVSKRVVALLEVDLVLSGRKRGATLTDIIPQDAQRVSNASPTMLPALEQLIRDEDHFYGPWTTAIAKVYNYSTEGEPMPHLFERIILLKTVDLFHETPDAVLSHIAQAMEEVHAGPGETIIEKGEAGSCLYIIVEGRVSVHDGAHILSELKRRDVVGEMALLDPEPRSASVTALEETTLLKLDREVFYDLMIDNIEIARGAITTLCRKIRRQNEKVQLANENL